MTGDLSDSNSAFLRLFDADVARAADKYRDLFVRLVKFFEWRHCREPEELAQETFARGFSRISNGADIYTVDPARYFFGIARNLLLEDRKAMRQAPITVADPDSVGEIDYGGVEARICLEQCLRRLEPRERDLILRYHTEDRTTLSRELEISLSGLRVRVHRVRQKLEKLFGKAVSRPVPLK